MGMEALNPISAVVEKSWSRRDVSIVVYVTTKKGRILQMKKSKSLLSFAAVLSSLPLLFGVSSAAAAIKPVAASTAPFQLNEGWNPAWSYNMYAPDFMNFSTLTNLPLAYQLHPGDQYVPELAASWTMTPSKITINLRQGVKWQDGQLVSSKDVIDTFLLDQTMGWGVMWNIANMYAPNAHQVVFELTKGAIAPQILHDILVQSLVSSGQYGRFVVPNLLKANLDNNTKILTAVKSEILKFNPTSYVGNGPFQLTAMTSNQADLNKFAGFFKASSVHVSQIVAYNVANNSTGWADMAAGKTDFSWTGSPKTVQTAWLSNPAHHVNLPWDWSQETWYFNSRRYPFTIPGVRQALAYAINRNLITEIGNGFMKNHPVTTITGLQFGVQNQWIPQSALQGFHQYAYNLAKAARLLVGLHFKKTANGWIMPNGKPFTLSIITPAGYNGQELSGEELASELTNFGIKSSASAIEQPGYWVQQNKGQYDISWGWGSWWHMNPINAFAAVLVNENYTPGQPGYYGLGFGPNVTLPGVGHVNLATNLKTDQSLTSPTAIEAAAIAYAKLVNEQLPFLPYADKRMQVFYSTQTYVGWPAPTSYLWQQLGGNANGGLALMLMSGYIHAK